MTDDSTSGRRADEADPERPRVLGGNQGVVTLDLDAVFDLLAEPRRRKLLYHLSSYEEVASLDDLATAIAAEEHGGSPPEALVDRVRCELHHVHLPRLTAEQVVEYDVRTRTVRYWGQPTLEEYVSHAAHQERDD